MKPSSTHFCKGFLSFVKSSSKTSGRKWSQSKRGREKQEQRLMAKDGRGEKANRADTVPPVRHFGLPLDRGKGRKREQRRDKVEKGFRVLVHRHRNAKSLSLYRKEGEQSRNASF
jgi:hypothetical protein